MTCIPREPRRIFAKGGIRYYHATKDSVQRVVQVPDGFKVWHEGCKCTPTDEQVEMYLVYRGYTNVERITVEEALSDELQRMEKLQPSASAIRS
jgi:hypothetical protein